MEVIVVDQKSLDDKIDKFKEAGSSGIHVLSDFDRTITRAFVDGQKVPSVISILRDGSYISEDYAGKAQALFDRYNPIEVDSSIPISERKKAMNEWWRAHFRLLIESGLNKQDIERAVKSPLIQLRREVDSYFENLYQSNIPLVILSSAGLGGDSISMILENNNINYDNIHIVSNSYQWDEKGRAVGVKEPIVHVMNKDETTVDDLPIYSDLLKRPYVLLLGDSLGDVGMLEGFPYEEAIKIGFLNDGFGDLDSYKGAYDVVIKGDGDFGYVNDLLKRIIVI